jgi:hypothetical protein
METGPRTNLQPTRIRLLLQHLFSNIHNALNPWNGVLEKSKSLELVKKFRNVYGTGKFISVLVCKSPPLVPVLSHVNPFHTFTLCLISILILSSHLRRGLPSGPLSSGVQTEILKKKLLGFGPLANYADRTTAACWRSSANFCGCCVVSATDLPGR